MWRLVLLFLAAAAASPVTLTDDGDAVTLATASGTRATLTRGGAALQSFVTPDRNGKLDDIVLGMDDVKAYEVRRRKRGAGMAKPRGGAGRQRLISCLPGWRLSEGGGGPRDPACRVIAHLPQHHHAASTDTQPPLFI
jgi:hypothetical protein